MSHVVRIQSRICVGGPALHSILLSEGLSYRHGSRYDTTLLGGALEPGEKSMEPFARARGVNVHIVSEMRRAVNPALDAKAVIKVASLLRRIRPEIVHTHTAKAGAIGRVAARLAHVPIILHTFHGHVFDGYFTTGARKMFIAAERFLARASNLVLAISEQQRDELVHRYAIAPPDKVRVVSLGLELDRFREIDARTRGSLRKELGIDSRAPIVLTIGRLVPVKRYDVLIDAFSELIRARVDAHLIIAGDGDTAHRRELERRARPRAHVHFLGWRHDLERLYADADAFALTSDNEGTPVAVIEALASGVPVVATRVGGVEDVVRPGMGLLVPRGSSRAVASALASTLDTPRPLPDGVRDDVTRRFSHTRLIAEMEALYDGLTAERPNGTRSDWTASPRPSTCGAATRC